MSVTYFEMLPELEILCCLLSKHPCAPDGLHLVQAFKKGLACGFEPLCASQTATVFGVCGFSIDAGLTDSMSRRLQSGSRLSFAVTTLKNRIHEIRA